MASTKSKTDPVQALVVRLGPSDLLLFPSRPRLL